MLSNQEYCELVIDESSPDPVCVLSHYTPDGEIKLKQRHPQGLGLVIAELDKQGWVFVFEDRDDNLRRLFFRRGALSTKT